MNRAYNFSAGPTMLAEPVINKIKDELGNWQCTKMSVMEISHRSKDFLNLVDKAEECLRRIYSVPKNYQIFYMHGGASLQASVIPQNLSLSTDYADYIISGWWGKKAVKTASNYLQSNILIDTADELRAPNVNEYQISDKASYLHYTSNETISGVAFNHIPKTKNIPLVVDMSSDILSKAINISDFGVIYASTQKNIGIAGLCLLIVNEDLLVPPKQKVPDLLNWQLVSKNNSMLNTPCTFAWYVASEVYSWLESVGLASIEQQNLKKAKLLYDCIDSSSLYSNNVEKNSRSVMNVPFFLADEGMTEKFIGSATDNGLTYLKGHRQQGGIRASIYNAMPIQGVEALVSYMQEFERTC